MDAPASHWADPSLRISGLAGLHTADRRAPHRSPCDQGALAVGIDESAGRVTGYSTGIGFIGHGVGESNKDLKALIASVDSFAGLGILIPTANSELFTWSCPALGKV